MYGIMVDITILNNNVKKRESATEQQGKISFISQVSFFCEFV